MYSKLTVFSKFCKPSILSRNRMKLLLETECKSVRRFFTKDPKITPSVPQESKSLEMACYMSSSNKKGNDDNVQNIANKKRVLKMRKKKALRVSKLKELKKNSEYFKTSDINGSINDDSLKSKTNVQNHELDHKATNQKNIKLQVSEPSNNSQSLLKYEVPHKRVHIEFMESQNLKNISLKKNNPQSSEHFLNMTAKPTHAHKEQNSSNSKELIVLETKELKTANSDIQNKQQMENKEKNLIKGTYKKNSISTEKDSLSFSGKELISLKTQESKTANLDVQNKQRMKNKEKSLITGKHKKESNHMDNDSIYLSDNLPLRPKNTKPLSYKVSKKSEKIKTQNQTNSTKAKVKIPTQVKSKTLLHMKLYQKQDKQKGKHKKESNDSIYLSDNLPLAPKNAKPLSDKVSKKPEDTKTQNQSHSTKVKEKIPIQVESKTSQMKLNHKQDKQNTDISKTDKSTKIQASSREGSGASSASYSGDKRLIKVDRINLNKQPKTKANITSRESTSLPERNSLANMLSKDITNRNDKIKILHKNKSKEKLMEEIIKKSENALLKTLPQKQAELFKTDKSTKFRKSSRSGSSAGSSSDGGDKQLTKEDKTNRPRKFWRNFSLTILPLILAFTGYALSNVGAAEIFKNMKTEQPSLEVTRATYKDRLKTEPSYIKVPVSEEATDEETHGDLTENVNENEENYILDDPSIFYP